MTQVTLKKFTASGSKRTTEIDPAKWEDPTAFAQYLIEMAAGVKMQRATSGKGDDAEAYDKAIQAAIDGLIAGEIPSGGGFTRLTDEEYALKEALTAFKVKFEKGETVAACIERSAKAIELAAEELTAELEADEVYKTALKSRKAKQNAGTKAKSDKLAKLKAASK